MALAVVTLPSALLFAAAAAATLEVAVAAVGKRIFVAETRA